MYNYPNFCIKRHSSTNIFIVHTSVVNIMPALHNLPFMLEKARLLQNPLGIPLLTHLYIWGHLLCIRYMWTLMLWKCISSYEVEDFCMIIKEHNKNNLYKKVMTFANWIQFMRIFRYTFVCWRFWIGFPEVVKWSESRPTERGTIPDYTHRLPV